MVTTDPSAQVPVNRGRIGHDKIFIIPEKNVSRDVSGMATPTETKQRTMRWANDEPKNATNPIV